MVFALEGEHVPSPQAKLQTDRTAKLQGDYLPQRPIFDMNTKIQITWEQSITR